MALPKLWWLDSSDIVGNEKKLAAVKEQLLGWDWMTFKEDIYESATVAHDHVLMEMGTPSIFHPGKAIVFYGLPSFHAKLAEKIDKIPNGVLLVVIARIDKTTSFFKKASAGVATITKLEDKVVLNGDFACSWIKERAEMYGLRIDNRCCNALMDICDSCPNTITRELQKLKHVAIDGEVSMTLIEMVNGEVGQASIMTVCDAIINGESEKAHVQLQRLLDGQEDTLRMCGFLMDWVRKLVIAQDCNGDFEPYRGVLEELKKLSKDDSEKPIAVPMFPKVDALYHSCKSFKKARKWSNWTYDTMRMVGELQIALKRSKKDHCLLMHEFVSNLV